MRIIKDDMKKRYPWALPRAQSIMRLFGRLLTIPFNRNSGRVYGALGKSLQEKDFRKNVYGTVELIASILSLRDAILNEEGNVEYIPKRIKLPKENQDAVEAYAKAKAAIAYLQKWMICLRKEGVFVKACWDVFLIL